MNNQALYISPERYAERFSLHAETVRFWCRQNILPARKMGRSWRIHVDARPKES